MRDTEKQLLDLMYVCENVIDVMRQPPNDPDDSTVFDDVLAAMDEVHEEIVNERKSAMPQPQAPTFGGMGGTMSQGL